MKSILGVAAFGAAALSAGGAQAENFALGAGIGTAGFELQGAYRINDHLGLRGSGNFLSYEIDETYDDIAYTGDLEMNAAGAFVDLRPFANAFTLTAGAYFGGREANVSATPTTNVQVGNVTYTPAEVGRLDAAISLGDAAPYVGIGFDNTFTTDGNIGFRAAIGVAMGDPAADLTSTGGTLSTNPAFLTELQNEENRINEDADMLQYYPVVSLGLNFKF
jgi:hypothetical protein